MRVLSLKTLRDFWTVNASAEIPLETWYRLALKADWKTFNDVKLDINSVDLLGDKLIFNIDGNNYRLICRIEFGSPYLFILWLGTHAEYNKFKRNEIRDL